eukprot:2495156-Ditylum_brightwellii.AAC.1
MNKFYELSSGRIGKRCSTKETDHDWTLHLWACSDDDLSAVQMQNQGVIQSLDASDAKPNTEQSICFIPPSTLKN